jgi:DtxR family Mn-dependent transcriptional regulator
VIGLALLLVGGFVVWPQSGLVARLKRARRQSLRTRVEDGLKHLYDYEYRGLKTSLESLSGALSLKRDDAVALADRLMHFKLIVSDGPHLRLTSEGRSYALRVIRVHRLWERYLSEETAVRETEWHERAEEKEHLLSPQEAEALAQKLGHPVLDPHGDPIPTAAGTVRLPGFDPESAESRLHGVIVHMKTAVGDLPQLVAQGLAWDCTCGQARTAS